MTSQAELIHWNPRRKIFSGAIGRRLPFRGRPVNNFGDLLGPQIIRRILSTRKLTEQDALRPCRIVSVGSIMGMARQDDVIWGTGINGKFQDEVYKFRSVDVRAVRGPLTREGLIRRGQSVPEIYGDPGLLVGELWPELRARPLLEELTIVPNLNDMVNYQGKPNLLDPTSPLETVLDRISRSKFVVGSSLHGIIVAESLGIPARLVSSPSEPRFKYEDYYLGSGRNSFKAASSESQALEMGGEEPPKWTSDALLDSFPWDLWPPHGTKEGSTRDSF